MLHVRMRDRNPKHQCQAARYSLFALLSAVNYPCGVKIDSDRRKFTERLSFFQTPTFPKDTTKRVAFSSATKDSE